MQLQKLWPVNRLCNDKRSGFRRLLRKYSVPYGSLCGNSLHLVIIVVEDREHTLLKAAQSRNDRHCIITELFVSTCSRIRQIMTTTLHDRITLINRVPFNQSFEHAVQGGDKEPCVNE